MQCRLVDAILTHATGTGEREALLTMLQRMEGGIGLPRGAGKNYDAAAFAATLRDMDVTPHVTQNNTNQHPRRGQGRVGWSFRLIAAAYNFIRPPKLLACA